MSRVVESVREFVLDVREYGCVCDFWDSRLICVISKSDEFELVVFDLCLVALMRSKTAG